MSKKMMKRSLALGALMAFVITGQAWADNGPTGYQKDAFGSISKTVSTETNGFLVKYTGESEKAVNVSTDSGKTTYSYTFNTNNNKYNPFTVFGQSYKDHGKDVTFNDIVDIDLNTNSARNTTGQGNANGISIYDETLTFNNDLTVDVHATDNDNGSAISVTGINAWGYKSNDGHNPVVNLKGNTTVNVSTTDTSDGAFYDGDNTDGKNANTNPLYNLPGTVTGVSVQPGATLNLDKGKLLDVTATSKGKIEGKYDEAATATALNFNGGTANLNGSVDFTAKAEGGKAFGVYANTSGYTDTSKEFSGAVDANFNGDTTINVVGGERAIGIYAEKASGDKGVNVDLVGNKIEITATAKELARGVVAKSSNVVLGGDNSNIKIKLDGGNQPLSDGSSNPSIGIWAWKENAKVVVNGQKLTIDGIVRNNGDMYGIIAQTTDLGNSDDEKSEVVVNAKDTYINIVDASGNAAGSAIVAMSEGKLNMTGNVYAAAKNAVVARGDASVKINAEGNKDKVVQLDGDIYFAYANNSGSEVDAAVDIKLANADSYLNGKIFADNEPADKVGTVTGMNLTLKDGATWNVTGDSEVNNLTLSDGNIKHNVGDVTVNKISGSGNVAFAEDSGHLHIDEGSGSLNLTMAGKTADTLNTASDLSSVAQKLGVSKKVAETDAVSAKVVIAEGDVKGEVTGEVTYVAPEAGDNDTYYHGEVTEVTETVNTKNQAIGDTGISLKLHWRAHVNDMNKRMGELRNAEGEHGVWARMVRGESEYKNTKAQYNQYQLGYDEKLSVDERWTVGAAVTFAEGDANYGQGSTDDKSTAFAIYGSKLNNDGTFVDLIARYAHLESDLDDVNSGKGDYATNGMSVSAEFGKRIQQGSGLWVEPQVELTYGTIDSAEFKFDSGKAVQVGDMDSLIGRVGFRIGKDLEQGNVYARASYLYDFEGETGNTFSKGNASRTIAEDLGGGWWEVGVGANVNLSKATYIYADVEKTFGGEVDTNWQWNLGVRYSF